eukprot:CAMPEP_0206061296 /NCGR_PEP_ID=MMETSP1466-20131121/53759_1 /ASSEMBLY_ACC=CAM_ASM_001126 /TAXON_ID=44452 /ORGANISM="Pavlova gyrans, Strain CCMP608" /LENGTH=660 /DNA_ID=CAMNT_0053436645 /DNA_START=52 /DNA_END=2034 /DNA_ORIENTATION=+
MEAAVVLPENARPRYVYERTAVREWMALHENGCAELASRVEVAHPELRAVQAPEANIPNPISDLGSVFTELDEVQDVLARSFEGNEEGGHAFSVPRILVIGPESAGKSSVLERICGLPLFPKDSRRCTILPIHVQLRRCAAGKARTYMSVVDCNGHVVREPKLAPIFKVAEMVHDEVQHWRSQRILTNTIVLEVKHPSVPQLDIVDLPGIRVDSAEENEATQKVVREQVRKANPYSVFLFTHRAVDDFGNNIGQNILQSEGVLDRSLGVLTKCDQVFPAFKDKLPTWKEMLSTQEPLRDAPTVGYGWIATSSGGHEGASSSSMDDDVERICRRSDNERNFFFTEHVGVFGPPQHLGVCSLVHKLQSVYDRAIRNDWAPATVKLLDKELAGSAKNLADLGLPEVPTFKQLLDEMEVRVRDAGYAARRDAVVAHLTSGFLEAQAFGSVTISSHLTLQVEDDFAVWREYAEAELTKLLQVIVASGGGSRHIEDLVDVAWACVEKTFPESTFKLNRFPQYLARCKVLLYREAEDARLALDYEIKEYIKTTCSPVASRDIDYSPSDAKVTINLKKIVDTMTTLVLWSLPALGNDALLDLCSRAAEDAILEQGGAEGLSALSDSPPEDIPFPEEESCSRTRFALLLRNSTLARARESIMSRLQHGQ